MGNCIEQYRAAMGIFHSKTNPLYCMILLIDKFNVSLFHILYKIFPLILLMVHSLALHINGVFYDAGFYTTQFPFMSLILFLSGDIEVNQGPINNFDINIIHLNIRSIRNKLSFLEDFIHDYEILCFTETHLDNSIPDDQLSFDGYSFLIRKDRNSFGGGVLMYFSDTLKVNRRYDLESSFIECIWAEVPIHTKKLLLGLFYRIPNSSSDILNGFPPNIILLWTHQYNNKAHAKTNTSSTLTDPICTSAGIRCRDSDVIDIDKNISKRNVWNYKRADFKLLNNKLTVIDWDLLINQSESIDIATVRFTDAFLSCVSQCIAHKDVTIRPYDKPWFDSASRKQCTIRDKWRTKALKTNTFNSWYQFKQQRNKVNNMKKQAKINYFSSLEEQVENSRQKKLFNMFSQISYPSSCFSSQWYFGNFYIDLSC